MEKRYQIAVLGGDRRHAFAAARLSEKGFYVKGYGLHGEPEAEALSEKTLARAVSGADVLLLPLPLTKDGHTLFAPAAEEPILLSDVMAQAPRTALFLAGRIPSHFVWEKAVDYATRDDFARGNAVPTAEGALLLALGNGRRMLYGASVGVVGFGRIGRETARVFHGMGADVLVFARRKEVREEAVSLGYRAADTASFAEYAGGVSLLINTVPYPLFGKDALASVPKGALLMELASAPYGFDRAEAEALGLTVIQGGGLPGLYFPQSAGVILAETAVKILEERNY